VKPNYIAAYFMMHMSTPLHQSRISVIGEVREGISDVSIEELDDRLLANGDIINIRNGY
jgi:hypothetical protein